MAIKMYSVLVSLFVMFFGKTSTLAVDSGCAMNFETDFPSYPPLVFRSNSEYLILPQRLVSSDSGIALERGEKILVNCAGLGNSLQATGFPSISLECTGNNILSDGKEEYHFKELNCKSRTKALIRDRNETCARGKGELFEISFNVSDERSTLFWYPLITTCFNITDSITFFSTHFISGQGLSATQTSNSRPNFIIGLEELYPDFSPNSYYKQSQQKVTFAELLGSEGLAEEILDVTYISRGHLSPDADFFLEGPAFATYFYVNVVPQWQKLNAGIWSSLEDSIRDFAIETGNDFQIYTGTHDVLTLSDINNNKRDVFLYKGCKLPVPKFLWKIVVDPTRRSGIAFVSYNNPIDNIDEDDWPCTDICQESNWQLNSNKLVCCSVDELRTKIDTIPSFEISQILNRE